MSTPPSARAAAALVLARVIGAGQSLTEVLATTSLPVSQRDRALTQELCYGVLRHGLLLECVLRLMTRHPLKEWNPLVRGLLLCGLYQLVHLKTPPHAAVGETVAATEELNQPWAKGFINGVLRTFLRNSETLLEQARRADPAAAAGYPTWWLAALQSGYPGHWITVVSADNEHPAMVLRVNRRRTTAVDYLADLTKLGIKASLHPHTQEAVVLDKPRAVEDIPRFREGWVSVQDAAAQFAAHLLEVKPRQRVLDACAAPGGKTGHLLEIIPLDCEMWALDRDKGRMDRVGENLTRLGLSAHLVVADATRSVDWWDGRLFDRILLDAPCSATGIVRRHPDIKWLRRAADINKLAAYQRHLMDALWPLLIPGGILLYATCSVLAPENEGVTKSFLADHADAKERPFVINSGLACTVGWQILPGQDDMDGFYYACITKTNHMIDFKE
ncbi:Ribosomal RNA small subunit methyltransferase B [Gammaproteobacteria bacterium]